MSDRTPRTMDWALQRSREIAKEDPAAERLLRAKCRWEHCTRTKVLLEWGDPVDWPGYTEEAAR